MTLKHELQNIISGDGAVRNGEAIQSITSYLRGKKETIRGIEKAEFDKKQEGEILINFIESKNLWFEEIDLSRYIGEGAEQKIFEYSDPRFVLKLNDSFFYEYWEDYFNSLLLHNFFFPHLAYELLGFYKSEGRLFSVVKQAFVRSTEPTNLDNVKEFLSANGFINKRDNDYFNPALGIILEDLHDENVLTEEGTLQFIDTVFFLMPTFFEVK